MSGKENETLPPSSKSCDKPATDGDDKVLLAADK